MPPRRETRNTTDNNNENPTVEQIFAQQLNDVLLNIVTQVSNAIRNGNTSNRTDTFSACKPKEFHGHEGALGILKWIEKMESVINISECADNQKVKYGVCSLYGKALTWWNTQVQARGTEAIGQMSWVELKALLLEEYCPKNEM
ncbi:hypothetical protein L1987_32887 [Smallanthus sonchifolius]|uniref:Uncharacterized protein n=1 Tax=Smallanthus sonchifolius TaxID=185202 RepID=A0ACB9HPU4_9ASTR|nr:hypothetical protein L1987_32887 [Smallanthus sonchifolius]